LNPLKENDIVGIVAPAGFIKDTESIDLAIKLLKSWGLQVKLGAHLFDKHNHFAGNDENRLEDFQQFLDDDSIKAIWCARGGYGSIRIIDKLNFDTFRKNPKWIIGYSDITTFHNRVNKLSFESIHSIMPTSKESITESNEAIESLRKTLFGKSLSYTIKSNPLNKIGNTKGILVGGNLSILSSLIGTKFSLNTTNKILFIEEIGEYKYRIDRMLHSLKLNGYFENCNGLILGNFTNIPKNDPSFGMSIEELILDLVKEYNFPICFDFKAGHITDNNALIFGRKITFDVNNSECNITFNMNSI
jgi:muramoyltetrapeptide carboxypeptidase